MQSAEGYKKKKRKIQSVSKQSAFIFLFNVLKYSFEIKETPQLLKTLVVVVSLISCKQSHVCLRPHP